MPEKVSQSNVCQCFSMTIHYNVHKSIARGDRLKEAKVEAEQIISAYRSELEEKYLSTLAKVSDQDLSPSDVTNDDPVFR